MRLASRPKMAWHLQRALWAARLLTVVLGLVVVAALLGLQHDRHGQGRKAPNRETLPPGDGRVAAVDVEEGVLDDGKEDEVAFSISLARLLGWKSQDIDTNIDVELDADRIDAKDWRLATDAVDTGEATTEWQQSTLLKAFVARFGSDSMRPAITLAPLELDEVGEMKDFVTTRESAAPQIRKEPKI